MSSIRAEAVLLTTTVCLKVFAVLTDQTPPSPHHMWFQQELWVTCEGKHPQVCKQELKKREK